VIGKIVFKQHRLHARNGVTEGRVSKKRMIVLKNEIVFNVKGDFLHRMHSRNGVTKERRTDGNAPVSDALDGNNCI
jgi:hypothetical protein